MLSPDINLNFEITAANTAEGWLKKESHDLLKNWQFRYFVLDSLKKSIYYYEDSKKNNLKGSYSFDYESKAIPVTMLMKSFSPNMFSVKGKSSHGEKENELFLEAANEDLMNKWITAINRVIKVNYIFMNNFKSEK